MTKVCLSQQKYVCRDKDWWQKFRCDKIFCHDKSFVVMSILLLRQKLYLWQLPPVIQIWWNGLMQLRSRGGKESFALNFLGPAILVCFLPMKKRKVRLWRHDWCVWLPHMPATFLTLQACSKWRHSGSSIHHFQTSVFDKLDCKISWKNLLVLLVVFLLFLFVLFFGLAFCFVFCSIPISRHPWCLFLGGVPFKFPQLTTLHKNLASFTVCVLQFEL